MAMQVPGQGPGSDPEVMVEMNITPLIDVMLVLLVMLIITIPIQLHSVNVDTPVNVPQAVVVRPQVVKISVNARSQVVWNGEVLPDQRTLEDRLSAAARQSEQPEIHINPERSAKYDAVAAVLTAAQRLGLQKIGVVGLEQFGAPATR